MQNKSGKWFAVLVIMLFLASMFSVILWKMDDSSTPEKTVTEDPLNTIPIAFSATSKGKVIELPANNAYLFFAQTNNADVLALDNTLKSLDSVMNLSSQIQLMDENSDYDYTYMASIVTSDDVSYLEINNSIISLNEFESFEIYPYALVEYDSFLVFKNIDLNLTKELSLGGSTIPILSDGSTLLNDEVEFKVDAQFTGNKLSNYNAYLLSNLTAAPKDIISIYDADFLPHKYIYEIDGNYDENYFSFIDYNFEYYNNEKTYLVFSEDYVLKVDSLMNTKLDLNFIKYVSGEIYVKDINYLGNEILIDRNIPVKDGLDYDKIKQKNSYRLELTFIRDKFSNGTAVYLGDMNV